jgi:hypothetical protein
MNKKHNTFTSFIKSNLRIVDDFIRDINNEHGVHKNELPNRFKFLITNLGIFNLFSNEGTAFQELDQILINSILKLRSILHEINNSNDLENICQRYYRVPDLNSLYNELSNIKEIISLEDDFFSDEKDIINIIAIDNDDEILEIEFNLNCLYLTTIIHDNNLFFNLDENIDSLKKYKQEKEDIINEYKEKSELKRLSNKYV